ncbi:MAG: hypothetical protein ABI134_33155, partial [Byssovorax sp.]
MTNEGNNEPPPAGRAWVAAGAIDVHGRRCESSQDTALIVVAVSVHENCPVGVDARVALMGDVARATRIPNGMPSLWVYPAGYFGFDAAAYSRHDGSDAWPNVDSMEVAAKLHDIVKGHPADAWVAFGVDTKQHQAVWLVRADRGDLDRRPVLHKIQRDPKAPLATRCFDLTGEGLKGAFFVCSEIAAYEDQSTDCRLIVDLAHVRVPGTIWSQQPGARMVHERVLAGASTHSAAILAHHHTGRGPKRGNTQGT